MTPYPDITTPAPAPVHERFRDSENPESLQCDVDRFNKAMCSGHTVSKPVDVGVQFTAEQLKAHDAAIAAQAAKDEREKVLEEMQDIFDLEQIKSESSFFTVKFVRGTIESLRQRKGEVTTDE